jgi:hypothetical protein
MLLMGWKDDVWFAAEQQAIQHENALLKWLRTNTPKTPGI